MPVFPMIAKTLFGLEAILAEELAQIGGQDIKPLNRAVRFEGDKAVLYKSNYLSRTALRILKPITSFKVFNDRQLYKKVRAVDWNGYFNLYQSFAVECVTNSDVFRHSKYVALKVKDAVVDQFREKYGERPSVNTQSPDIQIHIHISDKQCDVMLDGSGKSLDRRGYRTESTIAPINEVLAAGMLTMSGFMGYGHMIDPMCGSGTIPIEAAMMAAHIPPGRLRKYSFENWPDFDHSLFQKIKAEAEEKIISPEKEILGTDNDPDAIAMAKENARRAGVYDYISFQQLDFFNAESNTKEGLVMMNPPYGERIKNEKMAEFYKKISDQLKKEFTGLDAWIISSNPEAMKHFRLRSSRKIKVFNGPLECKLYKFELYKGSRKKA